MQPRLRSTLILGLGGVGHQVLVALKAILLSAGGTGRLPEWIRLLVFDTAEEHRVMRGVQLEANTERVHIGKVPLRSILHNLDRQEAIRERLGTVIRRLPNVSLHGDGAKQTRGLATLCGYWNYELIRGKIQDALHALLQRGSQQAGLGLNVVIVNSLGGGTGSGLFLDIAMTVRQLVGDLGGDASFCKITGVGLLPKALVGIEGPYIIPNTVAALKETDHLMVDGHLVATYPGGYVIEGRDTPFDLYHLIDGVDERGLTWQSLAEVALMAARGIYLQVNSQIGQKGKNDFDNLDQVLAGRTANGLGTVFSSYGVADLVWPAPAVARRLACQLLAQSLEATLLSETRPEEVVEAVERALAHWSFEELLDQLAKDEREAPLAVSIAHPSQLHQGPVGQLPFRVRQFVDNYLRLQVHGAHANLVVANRQRLLEELGEELARAWERLAWDKGITTASDMKTRLRSVVEHWLEGARRQRQELELRSEQRAEKLDSMLPKLDEATRRRLWNRGELNRAVEAYLQAGTAMAETKLALLLVDAGIQLLATLDQQLERSQQLLHDVRTHLAQVRNWAAQKAVSPLPQTRDSTVLDLADQPYLDILYQRYAATPPASLLQLREGDRLVDWAGLAPAELGRLLFGRALRPFEPVARLGIDAVIQDRAAQKPPKSPEKWLDELRQLASANWSLDTARLPGGATSLRRVEVLGVRDENQSVFGALIGSQVSTGDPHRVTLLVTVAGAPYSAIQNFDDYQRRYQQVRSSYPLHVLPSFLGDQSQVQLAFALGTLFDLVYAEGSYFYYQPEDHVRHARVLLGNGLEKAVQVLGNADSLAGEITERVDRHIAEIGTHQALLQLDAYWQDEQDPSGRHADLIRQLRALVRDFADNLRDIDQFAREQR